MTGHPVYVTIPDPDGKGEVCFDRNGNVRGTKKVNRRTRGKGRRRGK